jgi:hypothetical protein
VLLLIGVCASAGPAAAEPSAELIRAKRAEVFDRPEFRAVDPPSDGGFLRHLRTFFAWLGRLAAVAPLLFWAVLVASTAALVALLASMALQVRSAFGIGGRRSAAEAVRGERRVRLSGAYREEAARCAEIGNYTDALRFLFLSLVYRFDESGRVSFHKEYTNREYLALVGDREPVRDALRVLVDTLDDHWYAQRPCGRERYEACRIALERIVGA